VNNEVIEYTAEAGDIIVPKSKMPVTVMCQSGEAHGLHELRVYVADQNLTKEDFKGMVALDEYSTDRKKLALGLSHGGGNTRGRNLFLEFVRVRPLFENKGLCSMIVKTLVQMGREKLGVDTMTAYFAWKAEGWNHRVNFLNSLGFEGVPDYLEQETDECLKKAEAINDKLILPQQRLQRINPELLKPNQRVTEMMLEHGKLF